MGGENGLIIMVVNFQKVLNNRIDPEENPSGTQSGITNKRWSRAQFITPDVGFLNDIADFIAKLRKLLELAVDWLEFYINLLNIINDPLAAIIEQLIEQLNEFINSLTILKGVYRLSKGHLKGFYKSFKGL